MDGQRILVIDGDEGTRRLFKACLKKAGYRYCLTENGFAGLSAFYMRRPELVLMELELPDMSGMEVLEQIRERASIPVIVVSAKGSERDIVQALDAGADDYVVKPFSIAELAARIRTLFRRRAFQQEESARELFRKDHLEVDFTKRRVSVRGELVHLTPLESKILLLFIENQGNLLTHSYIQQQIWGSDSEEDYKRQRVHVSSLRKKIGDEADTPRFIRTEKGIGYRFLHKS